MNASLSRVCEPTYMAHTHTLTMTRLTREMALALIWRSQKYPSMFTITSSTTERMMVAAHTLNPIKMTVMTKTAADELTGQYIVTTKGPLFVFRAKKKVTTKIKRTDRQTNVMNKVANDGQILFIVHIGRATKRGKVKKMDH